MVSMETIRWGIIGCGDVAEQKSGPPLYTTPGSELVAVMRRDGARAAEFAARHGVPRWYDDEQSLLQDPQVNAVYIASPHDLHLHHVTQAAVAGKIVLCEKPMGTSLAEAHAIVEACRAHDVPLAVAYYRRYWPVVQAMRRLLAEDAIGRVVHVRVQLADYFAGDAARSWLVSMARSGGGALANAGSHWIDLVRFLLGDVTDVMARCSSSGAYDVEDTVVLQMKTAGGALVSYSSTWQSPIPVNEIDISGTQGRILAGPLSEGRLLLQRAGAEPELKTYPRARFAHAEFIGELVSSLSAGRGPVVPGEEAVAAWQIMDAAYRSCAEGRRVAVV